MLSLTVTFSIMDMLNSTNVPQQLKASDLAIFMNPWFVVPYAALIGWFIYKQDWKDIVIVGLFTFSWWVTGTDYMKTLVVGDELQINKVLPVMFGAAVILGIIIYLMFMGGD